MREENTQNANSTEPEKGLWQSYCARHITTETDGTKSLNLHPLEFLSNYLLNLTAVFPLTEDQFMTALQDSENFIERCKDNNYMNHDHGHGFHWKEAHNFLLECIGSNKEPKYLYISNFLVSLLRINYQKIGELKHENYSLCQNNSYPAQHCYSLQSENSRLPRKNSSLQSEKLGLQSENSVLRRAIIVIGVTAIIAIAGAPVPALIFFGISTALSVAYTIYNKHKQEKQADVLARLTGNKRPDSNHNYASFAGSFFQTNEPRDEAPQHQGLPPEYGQKFAPCIIK